MYIIPKVLNCELVEGVQEAAGGHRVLQPPQLMRRWKKLYWLVSVLLLRVRSAFRPTAAFPAYIDQPIGGEDELTRCTR